MKIKIIFLTIYLIGNTFLFSQEFEKPSDDKSYLSDYAGLSVKMYTQDSAGTLSVGIFDKVEGGKIKFKLGEDGNSGLIEIPLGDDDTRLLLRNNADLVAAKNFFYSGKNENAVAVFRKIIYPLMPLVGSTEKFTDIHPSAELFVEALINSKRFDECKSFIDALPLANISPIVVRAVLKYADAVISTDGYDDKNIETMLNRLNFSEDNLVNIDFMMELLGKIRDKGYFRNASDLYAKLMNIDDNPRKDEAKLWLIYCENMLGNKGTATIYYSDFKNMNRKSDVFSLYKFITGLQEQISKNYEDSLDNFAEGIVYGEVSDSWMPELLYSMSVSYMNVKKNKEANEILQQIKVLYPQNKYAVLAEKDIENNNLSIEKESEGN